MVLVCAYRVAESIPDKMDLPFRTSGTMGDPGRIMNGGHRKPLRLSHSARMSRCGRQHASAFEEPVVHISRCRNGGGTWRGVLEFGRAPRLHETRRNIEFAGDSKTLSSVSDPIRRSLRGGSN